LGQLAQAHQAHEADDQDAVAQQIKQHNEAIRGNANANKNANANTHESEHPELSEPHMLLASAAGLHTTAAQSTHQHSQAHHAITSGEHISLSAGKSLLASVKQHIRAFAQQGIRLFSAKGQVQVQAQDNSMALIAKQVLQIISTQDWINTTAAKGIRLQSGPTELTITPEGVKWVTPGYDLVHAAQHQTFDEGHAQAYPMPPMPISKTDLTRGFSD
jgi:uncharacterized protein (DUF2345 family)